MYYAVSNGPLALPDQRKSETMIDPQKCARHLTLNDPAAQAESLFDLLVWADQPNLKENPDYDEILDMLWLKIQASRDARDDYAKKRIA